MKQAEYYGGDDVRIVETPVPSIGEGELLVKVMRCGVCGSDILDWYALRKDKRSFGHEVSGVVAAVGAGVSQWSIGEPVFVHHHVPCFLCHHCLRGNHTLCPLFSATHIDPGGMAEYVRVPRPNVERGGVIRLSPKVSLDEASLIEPVACCLRGLKKADLRQDDTVLVVGAGFSGLAHVRLAKSLGARAVGVSDYLEYRLEQARQLGADFTINVAEDDVRAQVRQMTGGRGMDVVVVTPGSSKAVAEAVGFLAKGGTLYLFGLIPPEERVSISPHALLFSELQIIGAYSASPLETRFVYGLMESGKATFASLITHRFPLGEVGQALRTAKEHRKSLKVIVDFTQ